MDYHRNSVFSVLLEAVFAEAKAHLNPSDWCHMYFLPSFSLHLHISLLLQQSLKTTKNSKDHTFSMKYMTNHLFRQTLRKLCAFFREKCFSENNNSCLANQLWKTLFTNIKEVTCAWSMFGKCFWVSYNFLVPLLIKNT